ncbi:hypothetical protein Pla108_10250 [Botrimarina colliarenosi]|uniref:Uncharacterized protein n=1 Tax=Botrimarina colliarenosi TaxID=2528001 RepID=A0A5C6AKZ9_9BACT|nr:hypothetical protein [Botrimarina colliarenosi]TWU00081.1 hypothetical protein Pla108_10250 [Botrimarina colliarenosi]
MNISSTSSGAAIESVLAAQQSSTQSKIAYAVAGKALDAQRSAGDAAVALIESAGQLGAALGKGAHLDTSG